MASQERRVLCVVMDGIGVRESSYGNAVKMAFTPTMQELRRVGLYRTLKAHGKSVGMPTDADMGNSEVGHNALGAGRVFDQGAKLVDHAIGSGSLFRDACWRDLMAHLASTKGTLHLIGLLSDGNVHSNEKHLFSLLEHAKAEGVRRVRVHTLLDGRDVGERSAEIYAERLARCMASLRAADFDVAVASGGGRMLVTMDRYNADWEIVRRGWEAHVEGQAPHAFGSLEEAIAFFRKDPDLGDQNIAPFVITKNGEPVGRILDGDGVIFFNFRGDRALEIARAFTEPHLDTFKRARFPAVFFCGMMEYDGDLHIPPRYLVAPPRIDRTLGEYLVDQKKRQFACSETQKYGHVTYFWNGNKTGKISESLEEYVEIPSDQLSFDLKPWMKAYEITNATEERIRNGSFDFGRINYANGDMVGHTGNLEAAVVAVTTVDLMLARLMKACRETGTILLVTADHGNCDEMFESKKDDPLWLEKGPTLWPAPKTAHTLNPVPFFLYDPLEPKRWELTAEDGSLGNIASTVLELMGLPPRSDYLPSLVRTKP